MLQCKTIGVTFDLTNKKLISNIKISKESFTNHDTQMKKNIIFIFLDNRKRSNESHLKLF